MAIFGPRFDQAAAQSFARSFDPIRFQEFEMKKEMHQADLDQLATDKDILEAIAGSDSTITRKDENQKAGLKLL